MATRIDYTVNREFERTDGCQCDVDGFRRVAPGYVQTVAPGDLTALYDDLMMVAAAVDTGTATEAEWDRAAAVYADLFYRQAVAADCVFPCPTCKPGQYRRWRNGCYRTGHKRQACDICGPKADRD